MCFSYHAQRDARRRRSRVNQKAEAADEHKDRRGAEEKQEAMRHT